MKHEAQALSCQDSRVLYRLSLDQDRVDCLQRSYVIPAKFRPGVARLVYADGVQNRDLLFYAIKNPFGDDFNSRIG